MLCVRPLFLLAFFFSADRDKTTKCKWNFLSTESVARACTSSEHVNKWPYDFNEKLQGWQRYRYEKMLCIVKWLCSSGKGNNNSGQCNHHAVNIFPRTLSGFSGMVFFFQFHWTGPHIVCTLTWGCCFRLSHSFFVSMLHQQQQQPLLKCFEWLWWDWKGRFCGWLWHQFGQH